MPTIEYVGEVLGIDGSVQTETGRSPTRPSPGLLAGHPTPLGPARDQIVYVVVVATLADDMDSQHDPEPPGSAS
jgi:hypothetical protein